jgi:hypothetical protein
MAHRMPCYLAQIDIKGGNRELLYTIVVKKAESVLSAKG